MHLVKLIEERTLFSRKSFVSRLHLRTAQIYQLHWSQRKKKRDPPRSVASFNPVSAIKATVTWNLFAVLIASMTILTSSLLNCTSMPSNAHLRLSQKLTYCNAVPDWTSLRSLVGTWSFDPWVDTLVERVEERSVGEELWWHVGDIGLLALCLGLY